MYQNYKFDDPRGRVVVVGCGHISHIVKIQYIISLKTFFSSAEHRSDKLNIMMIKEGSSKILHFMIPGVGVPVLIKIPLEKRARRG